MLGFHPALRRLPQRNPDPASIGGKFHAGYESLERDDHALSIGQLYASDASDPGTAPANSVICAGEVLDFAQARDAPRQPHRRSAGGDTDAQAVDPKRIVV